MRAAFPAARAAQPHHPNRATAPVCAPAHALRARGRPRAPASATARAAERKINAGGTATVEYAFTRRDGAGMHDATVTCSTLDHEQVVGNRLAQSREPSSHLASMNRAPGSASERSGKRASPNAVRRKRDQCVDLRSRDERWKKDRGRPLYAPCAAAASKQALAPSRRIPCSELDARTDVSCRPNSYGRRRIQGICETVVAGAHCGGGR
jgi:hypothetical protein